MRYEISWWQFYMMQVTIILTSLTTFTPVIAAVDEPSRDMWISVIVAMAAVTVATLLVYKLSTRVQGMTVFQYSRLILGRYLGYACNALLTVLFVYWTAVSIERFGFFFSGTIYLRTPHSVFSFLLLALAILAAAEGIEFIGRLAEISGILIVAGILFFLSFTVPLGNFNLLRPVLADGWPPVVKHGLAAICVFGEATWISALAIPHVNRIKQARKAIFLAAGTNLFFYLVGLITLISIFDETLLSILAFPTLSGARLVSFGNIVERLEWFAIIMWVGAMGVKISLLLYGASEGLGSFFPRLKSSTQALLCGAVAAVWASLTFRSLQNAMQSYELNSFLLRALPLEILPLILFLAAFIRGIRRQPNPSPEMTKLT